MDSNISFDPNKLSNKEKIFLKAKLDLTYDEDDPDGCKVFKLKARNNVYPQWKIWETIWRRFGKKNGRFNPSAIAYSLEHGVVLYKKSDMGVSHLCGYVLCLNSNHLIQETHAYTLSRRKCHASRGIPWVCRHVPQCIIKTVDIKNKQVF
jgi:hypothetical protein